MMRPVWLGLGGLSLGLGILGIALPLLPTVPLLLLAALCFARGSPRVHDWLLSHPRLGAPIRDWRMHGAVGRGAKRLASLSLGLALLAGWLFGLPPALLAFQAAALAAVAVFLWTRPER